MPPTAAGAKRPVVDWIRRLETGETRTVTRFTTARPPNLPNCISTARPSQNAIVMRQLKPAYISDGVMSQARRRQLWRRKQELRCRVNSLNWRVAEDQR